jgi:hypothetical protein
LFASITASYKCDVKFKPATGFDAIGTLEMEFDQANWLCRRLSQVIAPVVHPTRVVPICVEIRSAGDRRLIRLGGLGSGFNGAVATKPMARRSASLDNPNLVPPRINIHTGSRLEWVVPDRLPEYWGGRRQE